MHHKLTKILALILGILLIIGLADPNRISLIAGGILVVLGEAVRLWASGHLNRNNEVTTSGPYAYVRDPLYLGRLLLLIGLSVMAWGYSLLILLAGLAVFFYDYMPRKYRQEVTRLEQLFGEEYREYAAYTRSLIPRLKPYPKANPRGWNIDLFWNENREQFFLIMVVAIAILLILRGGVLS